MRPNKFIGIGTWLDLRALLSLLTVLFWRKKRNTNKNGKRKGRSTVNLVHWSSEWIVVHAKFYTKHSYSKCLGDLNELLAKRGLLSFIVYSCCGKKIWESLRIFFFLDFLLDFVEFGRDEALYIAVTREAIAKHPNLPIG